MFRLSQHCRSLAVLSLWTIALVASSAACSSEPEPTKTAVWEVAFDASKHGALSGVWGIAADDVWTVGGKPDAGEIHHFDGTAWTKVAVPAGTPLLSWVYGFASDDVWTVGTKGAALHWDGKAWKTVETGTDEDLWGVWGKGKDDIWVVGGTVDDGDPAILRWQGGPTFEKVPLDKAENTRDATAIFKVWGIGDVVFAVGEAGLILQWNGSKWVAISGGAKANDDFVSLWGTSADHIVAVGGRAQARVATWDGSAWTTVAPSATPGLNAIYMTEPAEAVVGGIIGYGARLDVKSGALEQEDTGTSKTIHAMWCDGTGGCIAVGGVFVKPFSGLALVRRLK